ncbi:MAG: Thiolase [uncultured bacterium]|nr:MAG: Thiolase [uncultured bacterium]
MTVFVKDEHNHRDTTIMAKPRSAFRKDGSITAGNVPGLSSAGAAMIVAERFWAEQNDLVPMARLVSYGMGGVESGFFGLDPDPALQQTHCHGSAG